MSKSEHHPEVSRLKQENQRLRRSLEELAILNEIAVAINSSLSLDEILASIVEKCTKHLKVEQVAVLLLDEKKEEKPFQTMVRGWDTTSDQLPYRLDDQLTGWMLKNRTPLLIEDLQADKRFVTLPTAGSDKQIHSLLSVPLMAKSNMIGLISVFNKKEAAGFTSDDQRLLAIIGSQSAQVIENARLLEEEQKFFRVQQDLKMAHDIQMNLLPKKAPEIKGYDLSGKSLPAKEVGGDYFDFIPIDEHKLAFCLGDISGKGIPAALLMSNLQATVRGQTMANASVVECLERSNQMLFHNTPPEKFSTFFYAVLDTQSHQMTYGNAGHNYPFIFSKGKGNRHLNKGDIVLGIMDSMPFSQEQLSLKPGDIFVLYSDGITEAIDQDENEFDETGLCAVISENIDDSAEELTRKVIAAVQLHAANCLQYDDMTVLIIKREG